jgi:hypothetical protein
LNVRYNTTDSTPNPQNANKTKTETKPASGLNSIFQHLDSQPSIAEYNDEPRVETKTDTKIDTKTETKTENKSPSDFDDILNKLDLNQRPRENSRRIFSDSLSRAVGQGAQSSMRFRSRGPPSVRKVELKLGPTLGRQAHVEPERGTDLASALRKLGSTIAQNKVRQDAAAQRFHVRKGMVRKQKKMVRWKRLFKVSFKGTVQKIQRMQAQGW